MAGTFRPRDCGVAIYTSDLINSLKINGINDFAFFPIVKTPGEYTYESGIAEYVRGEINQKDPISFINTANNICNIYQPGDVFLGNHEFGFWARSHHYDNAVKFTDKLKKGGVPMAIIKHTILSKQRDKHKYKVTQGIINNVLGIVALSKSGLARLKQEYIIPEEKAFLVPHGVPDTIISETKRELKAEDGLIKENGKERRTVVMAGFLSRGKRIEDALEGEAIFVRETNGEEDPIIFIEGETHPEVLKREGEKYRRECVALSKGLGLRTLSLTNGEYEELKPKMKNNPKILEDYDAVFINKYLPTNELLRSVERGDVCLVTNGDREQIVSGQIFWYTSRGRVVIATPSPCAKDFYDEGLGLLAEFENPRSVADQLHNFYSNPKEMAEKEKLALKKRDELAWPNVGIRMIDTLEDVLAAA